MVSVVGPVADRTVRDIAWSVGLLAAGVALLLLAVLATHAGADWFDDAPEVMVRGADLQVVRGTGAAQGASLVVQASQNGLAAVAVPNVSFAAETRPRVEWSLRSAQPPQDMAFVWRTREDPGRTNARPLQWTVSGPAPLELGADEGWQGTITGLGLVVRGELKAPLVIDDVRVPPGSARATLHALFSQWRTYFPLQGYAVAFPFDSERGAMLPLAQALAIAVCLALVLAFAIARWRDVPLRAPVVWTILGLAWIALDARWQANLWRTAVAAHERYSGKDMEARWQASDDAALYTLAREVLAVLPQPPARIVIVSDNGVLRVRLGHFLYPHNVHAPLKLPRGADDAHRGRADHAALRSGDHVLLFLDSVLGYDAARGVLQWPDGHVLPVTPLLARPNTVLVRVR